MSMENGEAFVFNYFVLQNAEVSSSTSSYTKDVGIGPTECLSISLRPNCETNEHRSSSQTRFLAMALSRQRTPRFVNDSKITTKRTLHRQPSICALLTMTTSRSNHQIMRMQGRNQHHPATHQWKVALWALLLTVNPTYSEFHNNNNSQNEVAYVIEPFEFLDYGSYDWTFSSSSTGGDAGGSDSEVSVPMLTQGLFGESSLQLRGSGVALSEDEESSPVFVQAILRHGAGHNCRHADYFSIWFRPLTVDTSEEEDESSSAGGGEGDQKITTSTTIPKLRVTLFDDSDCLQERHHRQEQQDLSSCDGLSNFSASVLFEVPIPEFSNQTAGSSSSWKELRISVNDLNDKVITPPTLFLSVLKRVKGYKIEFLNSTSIYQAIQIDQLACVGGSEMFSSPLYIAEGMSFQDMIDTEIYRTDYYQSPKSEELTHMNISDGTVTIDYVVEQTENWGGFLSLTWLPPASAYYNMSTATDLVLDYRVLDGASEPGRVTFRVILGDNSNCLNRCDADEEKWYSFHSILDSAEDEVKHLTIPLIGDTDPGSSFWLTGWAGGLGNSKFDPAHIGSVQLEVNINSELGVGNMVTGAIEISNMEVIRSDDQYDDSGNEVAELSRCAMEDDVHFDETSTLFTRYEHRGHECCVICEHDPECHYAITTGVGHCYTASYLLHEVVGLSNTVTKKTRTKTFWMNDSAKRGDFCTICDCYDSTKSIDCRGKDLLILPKTFRQSWEPKILDLRDNDKLVFLGSNSFDPVLAENLELIFLGDKIRHLAPSILEDLTALKSLEPDSREYGGLSTAAQLNNWVSGETGSYYDVCCNLGETIKIGGDAAKALTLCDMQIDEPGSDSLFMPFVEFFDATPLDILSSESTEFMAEAADSPEMCAAYCAINKSCRYFGYDGRVKNAEHVCYLLKDRGTRIESICCEEDHYADANKVQPGWVSGLPPQTRHDEGNATVVVTCHNNECAADETNNYEVEYQVSLASNPLRGAVWIEPVVVGTDGSETDNQVEGLTITPSRVALYDDTQTATVRVTFDSPVDETIILVGNEVISCDSAFMLGDPKNHIVYISVKTEETRLGLAIGLPLLATFLIFIILVAMLLVRKRSRQEEAYWEVDKNELSFYMPPQILGRGAFGLVLLADYRGTKVAVKRVLPAARHNKDSTEVTDSPPKQLERDIESNEGDASSEVESWKEVPAKLVDQKNSPQKLSFAYLPSLFSSASSWNFTDGQRVGRKRRVFKSTIGSEETLNRRRLKQEFITEMQHLSKLRHPCITTVMGAVVENTLDPMLVMEYMEHGSLYDLLHNETMVLEGELLKNILCDITQGMRFLHSANPVVIHGDLKAQNILVDCKFRAKVADFGLTNKANKQHLGGTGTPFFMAPELLRYECGNSTSTDIYSFGVILYEVYSRKDPYEGEDEVLVIQQIMDATIGKRPPVPHDCPPQVQSMMNECLREDPLRRPCFEELDTRLQREHAEEMEPPKNQSSTAKAQCLSMDDIFPEHIAEALQAGRSVEAEEYDCVTIFCSDISGFDVISSVLTPQKVANLLGRLYTKFDELSQKHDVFKVETVGEAYVSSCFNNAVLCLFGQLTQSFMFRDVTDGRDEPGKEPGRRSYETNSIIRNRGDRSC